MEYYIMLSPLLLLSSSSLLFLVHRSFAEEHNLTSPTVTNWGTWGPYEKCPDGTRVIGVQLKTEVWNSWNGLVDDTCLNAMRFFCGTPGSNETSKIISSSEGEWGTWGKVTYCHHQHGPKSCVVGFSLRVEEEYTTWLDETATNNMRILCSESSNGFEELDGERWGLWTNPRICNPNQCICGLQTQVEEPQGIFIDDTALNNIKVTCCDVM